MRKVITTLLSLFGLAGNAAALDNAGIYLSSKFDLTVAQLSKIAVGAKVEMVENNEGNSFQVSWPDVSVTINTKNVWSDRTTQISGMTNWAKSLGGNNSSSFLNKIASATDILGCVIQPGYDKEQKVARLVNEIAKRYEGFIFTYQSFYNERGHKIVGQANDPQKVGGA